jgi:hypothetical protein
MKCAPEKKAGWYCIESHNTAYGTTFVNDKSGRMQEHEVITYLNVASLLGQHFSGPD